MDVDDFEELLADKPRNERWELIGGRVVRMMVGVRWEHAQIVQNVARHLGNRFVYDRADGDWNGFRVLDGLDAVLDLPAIRVSLPLQAIYRRVFSSEGISR